MSGDWTVLLIGGPGAVGKTTAARQIGRLIGASVLETDDVWLAMQAVVSAVERPLLHAFASRDVWRRPVGDLVALKRELAQLLSSSLEPAVGTHLSHNDRVVVEGVWLTPEFMCRPNYAGSGAAGRRRSVIVFEDDPARIRRSFFERGRGFDHWPPEDRDAMAALQAAYARWLRSEALARNIPVVGARPVEDLAERILAVV